MLNQLTLHYFIKLSWHLEIPKWSWWIFNKTSCFTSLWIKMLFEFKIILFIICKSALSLKWADKNGSLTLPGHFKIKFVTFIKVTLFFCWLTISTNFSFEAGKSASTWLTINFTSSSKRTYPCVIASFYCDRLNLKHGHLDNSKLNTRTPVR